MNIGTTRRTLTMLAICLALTLVAGAAMPASAADPPLSLSIEADPLTIEAGESTDFKVTLRNSGVQGRKDVLLAMTLAGPVDQVRPGIVEKGPNVQTDGIRRREGAIFWQGDLPAGEQLVINLSVASKLRVRSDAGNTIVLDSKAGPAGGDPLVNAAKAVAVEFPPDVDHADVDFEKVILLPNGDSPIEMEDVEVISRQPVAIELRLTNSSDRAIYSLLVDTVGRQETAAASVEMTGETCRLNVNSARVVQGRGFVVPLRALGEEDIKQAAMGSAVSAFLVRTEPGQTSVTRVRGSVIGTPDCLLEGQARAHMIAVGAQQMDVAFEAVSVDEATTDSVAAPKLAFIGTLLDIPPKLSANVKLLVRFKEFGDAPDSTNHFTGTTMTAYPGVDANFPTVFDPTTGLPQGPKHANGLPLHLGKLVSSDLSVDIGPRENLDPPIDAANLDVHDDGVKTSGLSFDPCMFTTDIDFEVTLTQKAVDYFAANDTSAYLNIWLDGNHDGDWEDSLLCNDLTAVEHIVIDLPIALSAAGTHRLTAPTGMLPVPPNGQARTMWLRATISDEPSVKTGSFKNPGRSPQEYGDGRGPANGFRWGETEDYLYSPWSATPIDPDDIIGPDLSIDKVLSNVQTAGADENLSAAAAGSLSDKVFMKAFVRNRGDRLAPGSKLIVEVEPFGGLPPMVETYASWCLTCIVASNVAPLPGLADVNAAGVVPIKKVCDDNGDNCRLEMQLGDVPPGERAEILLGWSWGETNDATFTARVEGPSDSNAGNNSSSSTASRLARPPVITSPPPGTLGWRGCLTCTRSFMGFAEPNSTLSIFADGFESGNTAVKTDENGFWRTEIALKPGQHEFFAKYDTVDGESVRASSAQAVSADHWTAPLLLTVDPSLAWDPTSFGITKLDGSSVQAAAIDEGDDSCGPWHFLDDAGRADLNGWQIPVWPGREVELGVNLICDGPAGAELNWSDVLSIDFTDNDGDGRYTASLTAPEIEDEVLVEFAVTCGDSVATYTGILVPIEPATLVNAETGEPLRDGAIELWQRIPDADGRQWTVWDAQAHGQVNPQTTDADGHFSFITPAGTYGLTAQIDGFQPFRAGPLRLQGLFPGRNIALTPIQPSGKVVQVRITEDGFDPPYLQIDPDTTVEWVNTDLGVAQVETAIPAAVSASAAATNWDSGLLSTGQRYRQTFGQEGSFNYLNGEDPSSQAAIIVRRSPPQENGMTVFLPTIQQ